MITHLDRNRLNGECTALTDEVAEELRLANITGRKSENILSLVHQKHDECLQVLKDEPEVDIDDVILAYRSLIHRILKKFNLTI